MCRRVMDCGRGLTVTEIRGRNKNSLFRQKRDIIGISFLKRYLNPKMDGSVVDFFSVCQVMTPRLLYHRNGK